MGTDGKGNKPQRTQRAQRQGEEISHKRAQSNAKKEARRGRGLEIIFNNASFGRLIRLRRNRIASRRGILLIIILLERSSILLPQASSEALFSLISVLIRVIRGRFLFLHLFALLATLRESILGFPDFTRVNRSIRQTHNVNIPNS